MLALLMASLAFAAPAGAQLVDEVRRSLGLSPDVLARSPRHVGLGGLTLVLPDHHQRIDLWEFAGNPAGLVDADTATSLEFYPGTASRSSVHDLPGGLDRQDFALQDTRLGYEAWRRSSRTTAFGVIGDYGTLRFDQPHTADVERRTRLSVPNTMGVISGRAPFLHPEHFRYGLRIQHRYQSTDDDYLTIVRNGAGEWLDQGGSTVDPPDFFTPDRYGIRTLGGGLGIAWVFGAPVTLALGVDRFTNAIEGRNDGGRYASETREERPFTVPQLSLTGRLMDQLEYIVDARTWTSSSDQRWAFTLSGGTGQAPINSRGHRLDREEEGAAASGRVRWEVGPFEIGAGISRFERTVTITAAGSDRLDSFNYFRNWLYGKAGTDTLMFPDSVLSDESREEAWDGAVAGAVRLPFRDASLGLEFHSGGSSVETDLAGPGAEGRTWDVRGGLEFRAASTLMVRTGYRYAWEDRDDLTEQNEFLGHTATVGLGYRPVSAAWMLEGGYSFGWDQSDFGDPTRQRSTDQRLLMRLRWEL